MKCRRLRAAALAVAFTGCSPESDSSTASTFLEPEVWRLADNPRVTIGASDGDERYQLLGVTSGWQDESGRIVIMETSRFALLFYDSAGAFIAQVGRRGRGPGEFESRSIAWPYRGDSIAAYDLGLRRVTVFAPEGTYARSFNNPLSHVARPGVIRSQSCCLIVGSFADGSFVGRPPDEIPTHAGPPRHSTLTLVRVGATGTEQDTIGTFASALYYQDSSRRSGVRGFETSWGFRFAIIGDQLVGGNGHAAHLTVATVSPSSSIGGAAPVRVDSIPMPSPVQPFTADLRAEYEGALRADYAARTAQGVRYYEGSLESNLPADYPETAPRFGEIGADDARRVWLERWTPRYGRLGAPAEYDLVELNGRHVARLTIPAGSRLLWAGSNRVLLLAKDSLDVESVRLYDIVRE